MALRTHLLVPGPTSLPINAPGFQNNRFVLISASALGDGNGNGNGNGPRRSRRMPSSKNSLNDADLASDLTAEVARIDARHARKDEAMKKSRELLFKELCRSLDSQAEELHQKWMKMTEDEKWVLVKKFLHDWGSNFHPLSARSVKDMVEEHLRKTTLDFLPGLKRIIGL